MALFSDGPPSTIDDLVQQDNYLLSVAGTESIDVSAKLQRACDELNVELTTIFGREASIYAPVLGEAPLDTDHLAVTLSLKMWHIFKTLELVYRDAYFNQLTDRYKGKWAEFQRLSGWARGQFIDSGAGLIIDPLPMPGSPVTNIVQSSATGGTVYLTLTFVNAEGEESSPSTMTQVVVSDGNTLQIGAPLWPSNATGWNVYCGAAPSNMTLQTLSPLTLGDTWDFVFPGISTGPVVGTGQAPNITRDLPRRIMRG